MRVEAIDRAPQCDRSCNFAVRLQSAHRARPWTPILYVIGLLVARFDGRKNRRKMSGDFARLPPLLGLFYDPSACNYRAPWLSLCRPWRWNHCVHSFAFDVFISSPGPLHNLQRDLHSRFRIPYLKSARATSAVRLHSAISSELRREKNLRCTEHANHFVPISEVCCN